MGKPDESSTATWHRVSPPGRWMDVLAGLLALGAVLTGLACAFTVLQAGFIALGLGTVDGSPNQVTMPIQGVDPSVGDLLASGVVATDTAVDVTVRYAEPAPLAGLVYALGRLPEFLTGGLAVLWLVQVLLRGHQDDRRLFSTFTAGRLALIGKLLVVGSLASAVLSAASRSILAHLALVDAPLFAEFTFPWLGLLSGFAALAVSEIVRRGLKLLEEVEGTV